MEAPTFAVAKLRFPELVPTDDFDKKCEQAKVLENFIRKETGHSDGEIIFLLGERGYQDVTYCAVVMPECEPHNAYVLCREAYLMTDNSKTIERIA
jgi:hypothetical protein